MKPIITEDMKKIYSFFEKNSKTYSSIPISATNLSKLTGYTKKDIINIIRSINKEKKFKNLIVGSNDGFYFINKENKATAVKILLERTNRCCSELETIQHLKSKLASLC